MSYKKKLNQETVDKIVECITSTVSTNAIYLFNPQHSREENSITIYVVTDGDESDKMNFEASADVGMSLRWLNKPMSIFCLSSEEFSKRARIPNGLEGIAANKGEKIYEKSLS